MNGTRTVAALAGSDAGHRGRCVVPSNVAMAISANGVADIDGGDQQEKQSSECHRMCFQQAAKSRFGHRWTFIYTNENENADLCLST